MVRQFNSWELKSIYGNIQKDDTLTVFSETFCFKESTMHWNGTVIIFDNITNVYNDIKSNMPADGVFHQYGSNPAANISTLLVKFQRTKNETSDNPEQVHLQAKRSHFRRFLRSSWSRLRRYGCYLGKVERTVDLLLKHQLRQWKFTNVVLLWHCQHFINRLPPGRHGIPDHREKVPPSP